MSPDKVYATSLFRLRALKKPSAIIFLYEFEELTVRNLHAAKHLQLSLKFRYLEAPKLRYRLKKAFSIVFLMIFLFNVGGYFLIYWGLHTHAKKELLHRLDADDYSKEDLIVLSIPMTLPYPNQESSFQRVDGEFEYQGEYYNLVKQRLEHDTLFLVCIKNHHEKTLANAFNKYTDLANNLPASAKHTLELYGKLFKDYTLDKIAMTGNLGWCRQLSFGVVNTALPDQFHPVFSPPPDYVA